MQKILIWNDQAVVQNPKCGTSSLYRAWKAVGGSDIFFHLDPNHNDVAVKFEKPIDLTLIMREPLDRYWAGLRQDFLLLGGGASLDEYLREQGQKLRDHILPRHDAVPRTHASDDLCWRLICILSKTLRCWRAVTIIPWEQQTAWCLEHWGYQMTEHHNRHDDELKQRAARFRAQHPEMDDLIRNLPSVRSEYQLWRHLHQTLTPLELTRLLVRARQNQ